MKTTKIIFWTATIIIFLFEGLMPLSTLLFAQEYMTAGTKPLGYPDYFAVALIIFKVLGALTLMIPSVPKRIKEWAYAGFAFNFLFACISHWTVEGFGFQAVFPLIILAILLVSYHYYHKIYAVAKPVANGTSFAPST